MLDSRAGINRAPIPHITHHACLARHEIQIFSPSEVRTTVALITPTKKIQAAHLLPRRRERSTLVVTVHQGNYSFVDNTHTVDEQNDRSSVC